MFAQHIKSKTHQKWLEQLNLNKANYYIENEALKQTVQQQRIIIAKLEKELQHTTMTIHILTQQLVTKNANQHVVNDLLMDFD